MTIVMVRRLAILFTLVSVLLSWTTLRAADVPSFSYHATLSNPTPYIQMTEFVGFNISRDPAGVQSIAGAQVCLVWNFVPTPLDPECNTTDENGNVPFFQKVEQTERGSPVRVDVTVDIGDGPQEIAPIVFTPI